MPVRLVAGQIGNLLAAASDNAHVLRYPDATALQLVDRQPGESVVEAVQGRRPRGQREEPIDRLAPPAFGQIHRNLPITTAADARIPETAAIAVEPPKV